MEGSAKRFGRGSSTTLDAQIKVGKGIPHRGHGLSTLVAKKKGGEERDTFKTGVLFYVFREK